MIGATAANRNPTTLAFSGAEGGALCRRLRALKSLNSDLSTLLCYRSPEKTALKWLNRWPGSTNAEVNARLSPAKSNLRLFVFREFSLMALFRLRTVRLGFGLSTENS